MLRAFMNNILWYFAALNIKMRHLRLVKEMDCYLCLFFPDKIREEGNEESMCEQ